MKLNSFIEVINSMDISDEYKADIIKFHDHEIEETKRAMIHETNETKRTKIQDSGTTNRSREEEHTKQIELIAKYIDPLAKLATIGLEVLKQKQ